MMYSVIRSLNEMEGIVTNTILTKYMLLTIIKQFVQVLRVISLKEINGINDY